MLPHVEARRRPTPEVAIESLAGGVLDSGCGRLLGGCQDSGM